MSESGSMLERHSPTEVLFLLPRSPRDPQKSHSSGPLLQNAFSTMPLLEMYLGLTATQAGHTALMLASQAGDMDAVKVLVEAGARFDLEDQVSGIGLVEVVVLVVSGADGMWVPTSTSACLC